MDSISSRSLRGLSGTFPISTSGGFGSAIYNETTGHYTNSVDDTTESSFFGDDGLIVALVVGIAVVVIFGLFIAKDWYYRKQGVDVWPRTILQRRTQDGESRNSGGGPDYEGDRALAEELQRQFNEDGREEDRLAKRKEREQWYEYYMENSLMIVKKEDLFYAKDLESGTEGGKIHGEDKVIENDDIDDFPFSTSGNKKEQPIAAKYRGMSAGEVSEDEFKGDTEDEEIGESKKSNSTFCLVTCDEHCAQAQLYLRLPPKQMDKGSDSNETLISPESHPSQTSCEHSMQTCMRVRHADGQCALCIDEYEEGDKVVWSNLDCTHAFHQKCLLQWLSTGKKRCPVCRHWFVPGSRIEDQKKEHGVAWEQALARMKRREEAEQDSPAADSDSAGLQLPQQEQDQSTQEGREQESSENTDPTDFTLESSSDNLHCHSKPVVGTMMNNTSNKVEDIPPRRDSEESQIYDMHQSDDLDEALSSATPPTCSSSGMVLTADLESHP